MPGGEAVAIHTLHALPLNLNFTEDPLPASARAPDLSSNVRPSYDNRESWAGKDSGFIFWVQEDRQMREKRRTKPDFIG